MGQILPGAPSQDVINAISDDLNTPKALSELFALVKSINNAKTDKEAKDLGSVLIGSANLLGLMNQDAEKWFDSDADVDGVLIEQMLKDREAARLNKDFEKADEIRKKIESLGVSIEDAPEGPLWKKL